MTDTKRDVSVDSRPPPPFTPADPHQSSPRYEELMQAAEKCYRDMKRRSSENTVADRDDEEVRS